MLSDKIRIPPFLELVNGAITANDNALSHPELKNLIKDPAAK